MILDECQPPFLLVRQTSPARPKVTNAGYFNISDLLQDWDHVFAARKPAVKSSVIHIGNDTSTGCVRSSGTALQPI